MRANERPTRQLGDQHSVYGMIELGAGFIVRALELCARLPELRIGSPNSINLGTLGSGSAKVKQEFRRG